MDNGICRHKLSHGSTPPQHKQKPPFFVRTLPDPLPQRPGLEGGGGCSMTQFMAAVSA